MITIYHNIIHNSFRKIRVFPQGNNVPYNMFRRMNDDKDDLVIRTLDLSRFDESKRITLLVSKVIESNGEEFAKCYKFSVYEEKDKSGEYKDEYIQVETTNGNIVCQETSCFINVQEVQHLIIAKGQEDTKTLYVRIPYINANGLYKKAYQEFWRKEYDEMAVNEEFKTFLNCFHILDIVQLYAKGIRQFEETIGIGIVDNTQRLLDEVQIQIELYNIPNPARYINNCKLFLQQCPNNIILDDAYVLWDAEEEFDFLWNTAHLDCRFSVGLEGTTWHTWVGINHHSNDDETYLHGIGGDDIDEECTFACSFFEDMHYHIIERGRK